MSDERAASHPYTGAGDAPRGTNGFAIAGLVCGIIGLLFPLLSILALIFGGVGLSRANKGGSGRGMAIAALVLGLIGIVGWIILIAAGGGSFNFYVNT